jgi:hypothetical protein
VRNERDGLVEGRPNRSGDDAVPPTYRVRYSLTRTGRPTAPGDVETIEVTADLDGVPGLLPAGAYILSIEDVGADQLVHWTRWPNAYRPGFGG